MGNLVRITKSDNGRLGCHCNRRGVALGLYCLLLLSPLGLFCTMACDHSLLDSLAVGCRFEPAVGGTSEALRVAVLPIREGKCLPGVCWILRASYSPLVNGGSSRYQQHTLSPGHSGCASASAVATPKSRLKTSTGTPFGKVAEVRASSALVP